MSEIRLPNSRERIWLGSYDSPEKAARAFDAAQYCLRGREANFNFPDNPPDIPGGTSLSPEEIQVVASRYANEEPAVPSSTSLDLISSSTSSSSHNHLSRALNVDQNTPSSSDGVVQVDRGTTIDWSFLSVLDSNETVPSDFGYFSGLDNMNIMPGEILYPPPPPPPSDDNGDDQNGYSQSSFLWNF